MKITMETPKKTYHVMDYNEALYLIGTTMSEMTQKYPSRLVRFEDFDKNQTHIYGWEISNIIYRHETDYLIDTKLFCDAIKELRDKKLIIASVIEPSYTLSSFFSDQVNTDHIKQEQINEECFNLAKKYPKANFSDLSKEFTVSFNINDKKNLQNLVQSLQTEFSSISPPINNISEENSKKILDEYTHPFENDIPEEKKQLAKIHKFPHKIPSGTDWRQLTIVFNDDENVSIIFNKKSLNTNYIDMGFIDRRNEKPNQQWNLLKVLAKLNGEITLEDPEAYKGFPKAKEKLSKQLQSYFMIDYDPFYPYQQQNDSIGKRKNSYKIKITTYNEDQSQKEENKDEILEFLKEQTPLL